MSFRSATLGRIDRNSPIQFTFNNHEYAGYAGDTLASALMANGVRLVARSFKYHRPRGLVAAGAEEANAIVQLEAGNRTEPDLKATQIELYEGLRAASVNAWPSLDFDLGAVNQLAARFIPAAFYYKTFMWPNWHLFEPAIRKAAGLGAAPTEPDPDSYDKKAADCDILIVGGGPAGLAALRALAPGSARVILCDDKSEAGGSLLHRPSEIDGRHSDEWIREIVAQARDTGARVLTRMTAFGYYDHNLVGLIEERPGESPRKILWKVRAKRVILATGAFERPIVFPDNDRPGIMLADSVCQYAGRFGAIAGKRAVVATNNDTAYRAALDARAAGIELRAIVDSRETVATPLAEAARAAGIEVLTGRVPTGTTGGRSLKAVVLHHHACDGRIDAASRLQLEADLLMVSGGWSPAVHLFSQSGGKLRFDEASQAFVPLRSVQAEISAGSANGVYPLGEVLRSGHEAALASAEAIGLSGNGPPPPEAQGDPAPTIAPLWHVDARAVSRGKSWIDFQNDVTMTDLGIAAAENFRAVEHLKRYTTMGMALDQGKTSNVNAIGIMSGLIDKPIPEIGTTKFRPPFNPMTIAAFAGRRRGRHYNPARRVPTHDLALAAGAKLEDYGGWERPAYFSRGGESEHAAVAREVLAVRSDVGLFDASPLGKIEVTGPDAGEFLNRVYVNRMKTLKEGRCRYGLMLSEYGIVFDDGILSRFDDGVWLVGTTSGHAGAVAQMLDEWLQCEWLDLDVLVENVTSQWAVMTIAGPKSRELLEALDCDIDVSAAAFPHMSARSGTLEGVPTRIARVSFTGELGYEISVPWGYGAALWSRLIEAGEHLGITPFGVESLMVMRTEKGFLHVGSDTDGATLPQDIGFGAIMEKKPEDFIGRRSAMRSDGQRADRLQLVGLEVSDGGPALPMGMHLVGRGLDGKRSSQGYVTSSYESPTLGRPVALGLVAGGRERFGEDIEGYDLGKSRRMRIVPPGGYDPTGERING